MNEESRNPWTDPELEARIVALVLGEASDFEREELNRLMEEWPDLAAFKEKIENAHRLLQQAAAEVSAAKGEDWKLSVEKRNAVLAAIEGKSEEQSAEHVVTLARREEQRSAGRRRFQILTQVAAALCVAGLLAVVTMLFDGAIEKRRAPSRQIGLAEPNEHAFFSSRQRNIERPAVREFSASGSARFRSSSSARAAAEDEYLRRAEPAREDLDYANGSRSALSAIRGTLDTDGVLPSPYYLSDDVQYVPSDSDFKLPPGATTPRLYNAYENRERARTADVDGLAIDLDVEDATEVTGAVTTDEANFALGAGGKPGRRVVPQTPGVNTDGDELSFPELKAGGGDANRSGRVESAGTTVSVPDEGKVLLGGIKRLESKLKAFESSSESGNSSRMGVQLYGESQSGEDWSEAAGPQEPADSPVVSNGAVSSGELPVLGLSGELPAPGLGEPDLGSQGPGLEDFGSEDFGSQALEGQGLEGMDLEGRSSGQQQGAARGERLLFDGSEPAGPDVPQDSLIGGRALPSDIADLRIKADDSGNGQADDGTEDMWLDSSSEAAPETEADAWRKARELANSPAASERDSQFAREDVESTEELSIVDGRREELVKQRITVLGDSLQDASGLRKHSYSVQVPQEGIESRAITHPDRRYAPVTPVPMLGTPIGQPRGAQGREPAIQGELEGFERNSNWYSGGGGRGLGTESSVTHAAEAPDQPTITTIIPGYKSHAVERLAKESLEELAELSDVDKNMDGAGVQLEDNYRKSNLRFEYFRQSEREQDELPHQRGRLADSGRDTWGAYNPQLLVDQSRSMTTWERKASVPAALIEKSAQEEAFSTFSLHVSDVSFKLAQAALASGRWPEAEKVRIEEFVNAFDYGDPLPTRSEKVSCRMEQSTHPFLQQRNLLRISMRTAAAGRSSTTPLRLTLVLDNSGSMERPDRQQTVRRAFSLLMQQLKPIDQVTLISFARQPRLLADKVSGAQSQELLDLIANLPSQGGTNIEAALRTAFDKAREQRVDGAQNRIVLLTDGAVNLGNANPESLAQLITWMRHAGIAFDAAGICADGLNDEVLEALTRKGDGRYYLLDSMEAADDGFARQIAGALRPSAKNVKVQVEFNPKRVGRYRLLGFEKHRLNQEDFRNDSVDAAEMAAAEAGVAMYQFEAKQDGEGDVGSVSVRFRDLSTGQMIEKRWPIPYEATTPRLDQVAPSLRIAASAALLAAKLRGEPLGETVDLRALSDLIAGLPDQDRNAAQVQQLYQMIQQARQVSGE